MNCKKCGQAMVRLEDGTLDCGCFQEASQDYPSLDRQVDPRIVVVNGEECMGHFNVDEY